MKPYSRKSVRNALSPALISRKQHERRASCGATYRKAVVPRAARPSSAPACVPHRNSRRSPTAPPCTPKDRLWGLQRRRGKKRPVHAAHHVHRYRADFRVGGRTGYSFTDEPARTARCTGLTPPRLSASASRRPARLWPTWRRRPGSSCGFPRASGCRPPHLRQRTASRSPAA